MEKLKALFVEHNRRDVELLISHIKKSGFDLEYTITESLDELESIVTSKSFDVVICEFEFPKFSGIDVINTIKSIKVDVPVILVSGMVPDDQALDAVLAGAKDYVLKDNLTRLIPAIRREVEALRQRQEKIRNEHLLEAVFNSPIGIRISDTKRVIVDVNEAYCEMMGYNKDELIGSSIDDLIPEDRCERDTRDYLEFIDDYLKTGKDVQVTKRDIKKDGSYIDVLVRSNVFKDGVDIYVVSNLQNVSETFKYRALFEESARVSKLGGWEKEIATGREVWTKQIYEIYGISETDFKPAENSDGRFHTQESWDLLQKSIKESEEKGVPFDIEIEMIDAKGTRKWCRSTGKPIFENEKVVKLIGSLQDITERKKREIEIKTNEEKYKFLFDRSPNPMLIFEVETDRIIDANASAIRMYGYSREEFLNLKAVDLRPEREIAKYLRISKEGRHDSEEIRTFRGGYHKKKKGDEFVVDIFTRTTMINDKKANIVVVNDVTEKFNSEQELLRTNNLLKALISNAPIGLVNVNEKGNVEQLWNPKAEEIFGWEKEEVLGKRLPYVTEEKLDEFHENLNRGIADKKPFITEIERTRKNGEKVYLREFVTPVISNTGEVKRIMLLTEDITEKKKVEIALISSEQKYRDLVEASHDLVWRIDVDGNFDFINNASNAILGYSPVEMIGNKFSRYINPDKREETVEVHESIIRGNVHESFPLEMLTNGGEIKYLSATAYPLYNDQGIVVGCSGTASDITHIQEYQSQLEASLAEKEVLIKEIHHRVKNNLAVISGLFVLQSMHIDDKEVLQILNESQSRIKSIAKIHEKLYQNEVFSSIEIKDYLENLIEDIQDTYKREDKTISINVVGDKTSLNVNQAVPFGILANELIINAYKYAFEGKESGTIEISISIKGKDLIFKVSDDGIGLPKDFDTSKLSSLGMTLIRTLADQLEADFTWLSKPNKGVTFSVIFEPHEIAKSTWVQKKPDRISTNRLDK